MKKVLLIVAAVMGLCLMACAQNKEKQQMKTNNNVLVAYFSATGNTAKVAQRIAEISGGTLYEIVPQEAYTSADLNWHNQQSRSSVEMNDSKARPVLKSGNEDFSAYDVIFIGYPIWWDQAPRVINTFIESYDLKGKAIVPFATSGGSGIGNSVAVLRKEYPSLNWHEGKLLNRASDSSIEDWINDITKKQK